MTNPVQQRLRVLEEQWEQFVAQGARLLCWQIEEGDGPILDTFFTVMQHQSSRRGELFVELDAPFTTSREHGATLVDQLARHYRELEPTLRENGLQSSWAPSRAGGTDIALLYQNALAFVAAHRPLFDTLVLVLDPTRVADSSAWQLWLLQAATYIAEPNVKLVVLDSAKSPMLTQLASSHRVRVQTAGLAMRDAYVEVSEQAGGLGTPAGAFRHAYTQMAGRIGEGDIAGAEQHAESALAAANGAGWSHLVVAVECALAGAYFAATRFVDAIACYHRAEAAADRCQPEPYAPRLKLTAQLGRGGAFLAAGAFHEAAQTYQSAVEVAVAIPDLRLELECHRMAAYAFECAADWDVSWQEGLSALAVGKRMDEETRRTSTLAYAADGLCRVCRQPEYTALEPRVEREIEKLLGSDWRILLRAGEA